MDIIFMNSENSKTSDPHRLLFNISDKINLKRSDKDVAFWNLSIYYTQKNKQQSYKNIKRSDMERGIKSLNYLMNHILYQIFNIILNIS